MSIRHLLFAFLLACILPLQSVHAQMPALVKEKDLVIYEDPRFYSAFPSVLQRPDGELLVAFRRAPERRHFGEGSSNHVDPNSYLVLVRSRDNGATWTEAPELILAHPFGGSQDPCMIQLRDGSILCTSYGWAQLRNGSAEKVENALRHGDFVFMGGYYVRSFDGGKTWSAPMVAPPTPGDQGRTVFGEPVPAYNRGPLWESRSGALFWAVASQARLTPRLTEVHLLASNDGGLTWEYRTPIAQDEEVTFNETALYETQGGDLIAFLRTANFNDHTAIARSTDGGKTFGPWEDAGFQGHPHCATALPDGRVLLVYGYRHAPFGIRARVLDPECRNIAESEEIILRDDGGSGDLGYPWVTQMADGKYLVAYYFNKEDGTRHIAGTILSLKE